MFNSFFDNESNALDQDEDAIVCRSDDNDENESNDTETHESDITETEMYEAIKKCLKKDGKAPGPDRIIGEFLKNPATRVILLLVRYFNFFFFISFFLYFFLSFFLFFFFFLGGACTRATGQKQLCNLYLRKAILISLIIT